MPVVRFTDSWLRSLKADKGYDEYFDSELKGFFVRVTPGGTRVFSVMCRRGDARERKPVGVYSRDEHGMSLADARRTAAALQYEFKGDKTSTTIKQGDLFKIPFPDLALRFIEEYSKIKKVTWRVDEERIARHLLPAWKGLEANEISGRHVLTLLKSLRPTPVEHNHVKSLVSKMYKWGIKEGLVEINPAAGIEKEDPGNGKERVYDENEIRRIWTASEQMPLCEGAYYRFGFMVGQRLGSNLRGGRNPKKHTLTAEQKKKRSQSEDRGEILFMEWSEIDWNNAWWTIPGTRTKNGLEHRVPLMPTAIELLRQIQADQHRRHLTSTYVWLMTRPGATENRAYVHKAAELVRLRPDQSDSVLSRELHTAFPDHAFEACRMQIRRIRNRKPSQGRAAAARPPLYPRKQYLKVRQLSGVVDFSPHDIRRTVGTMLTSSRVPREELAKLFNHISRKKNSDVTGIYDRYGYDIEKRDMIDFWEIKLKAILANDPTTNLNYRAFVTQRWAEQQRAEAERLVAHLASAPASTSTRPTPTTP